MPDILKVSIALTAQQVTALKEAVEAGEYATTSEVVREALREWQWKRQQRQEDFKHLRKMWRQGKASGAAAPLDLDSAREHARERLRKASERIA